MNEKDRLFEYVKYKGMSIRQFQISLEVSSAYFYNIDVIAPKVYRKIAEFYPDLNIEWVKTGEGKMLQDTTNTLENNIHVSGKGDVVSSSGNSTNYGKENVFNPSGSEGLINIIMKQQEQMTEQQKLLFKQQEQIALLLDKLNK